MELDLELVGQAFGQTMQQCSAACEVDTSLHNIGIELRWRFSQSLLDGSFNLLDVLVEAEGNLLITHRDMQRQVGSAIRTNHHHIFGCFIQFGESRTYLHLDSFGSRGANAHVVGFVHML